MKLHCGACHVVINNHETVTLGEFNTVVHVGCFSRLCERKKDSGLLGEIISKYDFFHEIRLHNHY